MSIRARVKVRQDSQQVGHLAKGSIFVAMPPNVVCEDVESGDVSGDELQLIATDNN